MSEHYRKSKVVEPAGCGCLVAMAAGVAVAEVAIVVLAALVSRILPF